MKVQNYSGECDMDKHLQKEFFTALSVRKTFADSFRTEMLAALKKYDLDGKILPNIEMSECVKQKYVGTIKIYGTKGSLSLHCPYSFVFVSDHKHDNGKPIYKHWFDFSSEWAAHDKTLEDFVKEEIIPWCRRADK